MPNCHKICIFQKKSVTLQQDVIIHLIEHKYNKI